jgi:hypothetical protein
MKFYSESFVLKKLYLFGIPSGLAISLIGSLLLNTNLIASEYSSIFKFIYACTGALGLLFIFNKSTFINQKFSLVSKSIGLVFLIVLSINLLREFNVVKIESIEIIIYVLITSLYVLYLNFFLKKVSKITLDYLKICLLSSLVIVGFLNLINLAPNYIKHFTSVCFWSVVILMVLSENRKALINGV